MSSILDEIEHLLADCPDCGARVLELDAQRMRLDWPAVPQPTSPAAIFALIKIGDAWVAGAGGPAHGDLGHELHEHQPAGAPQ